MKVYHGPDLLSGAVQMMFTMFSTAVPWAVIVVAYVLKRNADVSFDELTKFSRRAVPRRPRNLVSAKVFDSTGGYVAWIKMQNVLSCVVASLLFCLSTGQLEAWWELVDPAKCSAPKAQEATFKYPACGGDNFTAGEGWEYFNEQAGDTGIPNANIMAMNDTCWQDSRPVQACPFATTAKVSMADWISPNQWMHRIGCFLILEHVGFWAAGKSGVWVSQCAEQARNLTRNK